MPPRSKRRKPVDKGRHLADFGPDFSLTSNPRQNLAESVVTLLDWKSYDDYEKDMTQLCP
jgi:hypothetical protein